MYDFMPVLSKGAHKTPKDGACIMEMVSYVSGDEWTDMPACTDPLIAKIAQIVNDSLSNKDRHLILPYFDRLFNTRFDQNTQQEWHRFVAARRGLKYTEDYTRIVVQLHMYHIMKADNWDLNTEETIDILAEILDFYDYFTERKEVPVQPIEKVKELACQN